MDVGRRLRKHQAAADGPGGRPVWLFARLLLVFGFILLLLLGGVILLGSLATAWLGGLREWALAIWLAICGLGLILPLVGMKLASSAFRGIATPLAAIMDAADAVADGDFSVRVSESGRHNQFVSLARSFNRMTAELEAADERRRNLTADVAHELRNPLHIIQGNLEGVLDGVYEPSPDHLEATLAETRTLARLVDDLHTMAEAESGQLSLRLGSVDVVELLSDVKTSFSGQAEARNVRLTTQVADVENALTVWGDADRLDQVLSNLIANALRYTPTGGSISVEARPTSSREVQIKVADTGIGIPDEDLPRIFDRFWRGERSRSHIDGGGAGLGLAIARGLVEAQGGSIDVVSTTTKGTTFTITLPRSSSAGNQAET